MNDANQLFAVGVGLILIMMSLRIIRKTIADLARDRLFELRDEVRARFAEEGMLDHPAYKHLRALVNGYLANIERLSLISMVAFAILRRNAPPPLLSLPKVGKQDGDLKEFVRYVIDSANSTTAKYLLLSNIPLAIAGFPVLHWADKKRLANHQSKAYRPEPIPRSFQYPKMRISEFVRELAEERAQGALTAAAA